MVRITLLFVMLLSGCHGGSSGSNNPGMTEPPEVPQADFSDADAWLEDFVTTEESFTGGSMIIVDKAEGVIHKSAFGDHDGDTVVLLASASKVPSVSLLMALDGDDTNVEFDMTVPIENYLPWMGAWDSDITTEHLVSNRSGLPGLDYLRTNPVEYFPHACQFTPGGTLLNCAETLFTTAIPSLPTTPANTAFDYGGSPWQISGGVAELVGGGTWNQLWDQYIAEPCGLEVATYGNSLSAAVLWDGSPDSLLGLDNPSVEGGLMSNLDDYARLISMYLNEGMCGDQQVLSPAAVSFMREVRTPPEGDSWGYGMGWWIIPPEEGGSIYLYVDPGFYGSISWVDIERDYGGVVFFEEYTGVNSRDGSQGVVNQLIPIIEAALDAVP